MRTLALFGKWLAFLIRWDGMQAIPAIVFSTMQDIPAFPMEKKKSHT
jgi:hypothetical protein